MARCKIYGYKLTMPLEFRIFTLMNAELIAERTVTQDRISIEAN